MTSIKAKLDKAHHNNLTPPERAMAKPRHSGGISSRPAPNGPAWAVRQQVSTNDSFLCELMNRDVFIFIYCVYLSIL